MPLCVRVRRLDIRRAFLYEIATVRGLVAERIVPGVFPVERLLLRMSNFLTLSLLVGVGGFAGSVARYALSVAAQRLAVGWPAGTLVANVLGCLLVGIVTGLYARGSTLSPEVRLVLATGFCGGFTTMSSLMYEVTDMIRVSEYVHAAAYMIGTLVLSMSAFVVGVAAVTVIIRIGGGAWN